MKSIYEQLGGRYVRQGDYEYPALDLPPEEECEIGVWGQRRCKWLKERHRVLYYNLLTSGKLNKHLAHINEEAQVMTERLVKEMAQRQGITEALKARDMMAWVGAMNNIRNAAEEIVREELIYGQD